MRSVTLKVLSVAVLGIGVGAAALIAFRSTAASATAAPQSSVLELAKGANAKWQVYSGALKANTLRWNGKKKEVVITRSEKETAASDWSVQTQQLSASFFILDVRSRCDQELFVAGAWPTGTTVIEKWRLAHPPAYVTPPGGGSATYMPIAHRGLPSVRRDVLFEGSQLGLIRSIEVDPQGRFLLLLSNDSHSLYRLDLVVPGSTPQAMFTTQTLPQLAGIKSVLYAKHVTEGSRFLLLQQPRGESDVLHLDANPYSIFLDDPDDDGVLATPNVIDEGTWDAAGYGVLSHWALYGPSCTPP